MARINVDDYAFDDPHFDVLARSLRCLCDSWHALGCCLRVWHQCASRRTDTIRPAQLGEWQGEVIRVRGTKGRTDYLDRMDQAKSLPERILDHMREHGRCKRKELRQHYADAPRSTFYRVINQLVADDELTSADDTLSIPTGDAVPRKSRETPENVPGMSRDAVSGIRGLDTPPVRQAQDERHPALTPSNIDT